MEKEKEKEKPAPIEEPVTVILEDVKSDEKDEEDDSFVDYDAYQEVFFSDSILTSSKATRVAQTHLMLIDAWKDHDFQKVFNALTFEKQIVDELPAFGFEPTFFNSNYEINNFQKDLVGAMIKSNKDMLQSLFNEKLSEFLSYECHDFLQ